MSTRQLDPAWWLFIAVLSVLALGMGLATLLLFQEAQRAHEAAQTARAQAEVARSEAEAITSFLEGVFAQTEPEDPGQDLNIEQVFNAASTRATDSLTDQPRIEGQVRLALGQGYLDLGQFELAEIELLRARTLLREACGDEHEQTRAVIERIIELYQRWGQPDRAAAWRDGVEAGV